MKKITLILIILFSFTNCKAQEGRVEALGTIYRYEITNGTYLKDTENIMPNYTGLWKGVYNGKHFRILVTKVTKERQDRANGKYWYEDGMYARYEVFSGDPELPSSTIIASSMNTSINAPLISVGSGKNNQFKFAYSDTQFCGAEGELVLRRNLNNPNELTYLFSPKGHFVFDPDCPYNGTIPVPLPHAIITLTRVN